jgi:regulator of RNase E activity RraA
MNADTNYHEACDDRLEKCYSGAVYDTPRAMGFPNQLLPQTIRPLDSERVLGGKMFTVSGHVDLTLDAHTTLLESTKLLPRAPGGSVGVCQPNHSTLADRDGAVIIPQEIIADVTDRVEEVLRTENKVRTAILKGVDPVDGYLQYRKF